MAALWATVLHGCFLLAYDVSEAPDANVDVPEDAGTVVAPDGSVSMQQRDAQADAGQSLDARTDDAETALDATTDADDAAPFDASSDAARADASQLSDAGLGTGWWSDAAVSNLCAMPACDMMCTGQNCVFDCNDQTTCKTHCMAMSRCYSDCRGSNYCEFKCDTKSNCSLDCGGNAYGTCSTKCDANSACQVDCHGNASCSVQCDMNSYCDVDCRNTSSCSPLKCDPNASCLVYCGNNDSTCTFDCGTGGLMSCPGNIVTCNRLCP